MNKYGIAGRELMKGNIGNAITAIATKNFSSELTHQVPIQPSRYRNGNFYFGVNGGDKAFIWGGYNSSLLAYQRCPIVSSVINKSAQATVNGKPFIMNDDGKESQKIQAKQLRRMFMRPNGIQTGKQFRAQGNVYKRIYGYCPILIVKPVGFESDYSTWKLWNIPPWMMQVEDNTDWFFTSDMKPFKSIRLTYMGRSTYLNLDSVFFLKENQISTGTFMSNSNTENVSLFLPDSKLLYLEEPIDTFCASLGSRGSLVRDRGPQWILSNDSENGDAGVFPVAEDEVENIQKGFQQYGIMAGQRKAIITDAKLKLQTVGFDVGQLKLLEGEIQDAKLICDGLNYPPYLLGLVDAKFDNQQIAERNWYTNSIIPDTESEDEQWNEYLNLDEIGLNKITDYSHLPALQENVKEMGQGRMFMNQALLIEWLQDGITWNRWRELLGEDTVVGMDVYYSDLVKSGRILPAATAQAIATSANNAQIITQNSNSSQTTTSDAAAN